MNRFRVVQFNMQFGQVWDQTDPDAAPVRIEATIAEIQAHAADVIMLQEVEQARPGGHQADPPPNFTRLQAELSDYDGYFGYPRTDPRELPFGIGLAIFSRTPLSNRQRVDLPSPPIEFDFFGRKTTPTDRVLIRADTTIAGRTLHLLNTHLLAFFMLGTSSGANPEQRNIVARQLAESHGPTILSGDFNVRRHHAIVEQFAGVGYKTVQDSQVTWRRQPFVLDHIFYNPSLRCVAHRVIPTLASDHHVLVGDFEFV